MSETADLPLYLIAARFRCSTPPRPRGVLQHPAKVKLLVSLKSDHYHL